MFMFQGCWDNTEGRQLLPCTILRKEMPMAATRRDNRGIVLEKGESQDKTGRYRYRYYDDAQQAHDVYS